MPKSFNVLLLGSGGREHALAWKFSSSPLLDHLFIAPGNAGTASLGQNLPISENDFPAIRQACLDHHINMVVVGPEVPLVNGIHDFFLADPLLRDIPVIGPESSGARLEGSKAFAKEFMIRHNIPTAAYKTFHKGELDKAVAFMATMKPPYVLKADGLAAGKGVLISASLEESRQELANIWQDDIFGEAGKTVVIEQFLHGIELSAFVLTDGRSYLILPEAKDYKRIGEGDTGPNTGGMGSISPVPFAGKAFLDKVEERIIKPTINGLISESIPYKGFIFFGLMNVAGEPYVIEYNCRLGDPETEAILPRIKTDLLELFDALANNQLAQKTLEITPHTTACVMLVSGGYPGHYPKGKTISIGEISESMLFHAGTAFHKESGELVTNGGRVIAVCSTAPALDEALANSFHSAEKIIFEGKYFRHDIGKDLLPSTKTD